MKNMLFKKKPKKWEKNEIVLIAQTKKSITDDDKSIKYIMKIDEIYEDIKNESKSLWNKDWKFIIKGKGGEKIEPFNIEEIQQTQKCYSNAMTYCYLEKEDEEAVLNWIKNSESIKENISIDELIEIANKKIGGTPNCRERIDSYFHRPTNIRNKVNVKEFPMEYYPEVLQAIPTKTRLVYLYFDDGTIRLYNAAEILTQGVFQQLAENGSELFLKSCTVLNGTLAWTPDMSYSPYTCLDLDPTVLYNNCPIVTEPKELFVDL